MSEEVVAAKEGTVLPEEWVTYRDDDWYWTESSGSLPTYVIGSPSERYQSQFVKALRREAESRGSAVIVRGLNSCFVKDPVHRYIEIPPPLKEIVDSPAFQRLRGLRQNGTAYLVFPSLQSTRFEHSLGAMSIASRIVDSLFLRSDPATLQTFAANVLLQFGEEYQLCWHAWLVSKHVADALADTAPSAADPLETIAQRLASDEEEGLPLAIMHDLGRQGDVRRATLELPMARHLFKMLVCHYALLHDIGHLPFSHTLEDPLERLLDRRQLTFVDAWGRGTKEELVPAAEAMRGGATDNWERSAWKEKLHERLSASLVRELSAFTSEAWREGLLLAQLAETPLPTPRFANVPSSVFTTAHELVSAKVDVDRLDFVARDGYESGASFGHFDLDRVLRAARLVGSRAAEKAISGIEEKVPSDRFSVAFDGRALRDLESVILERAKLYSTIAGHHRAVMYNALMGILTESVGDKLITDMNETCNCDGATKGIGRVSDLCATTMWRQGAKKGDAVCHLSTRPLLDPDHALFSDAEMVRWLRTEQIKSRNPALAAVAMGLLARRRNCLALYKRPDDLEPVRERLANDLADAINSVRTKTKAALTPRSFPRTERISAKHVLRLLSNLRRAGEPRAAMRQWADIFRNVWLTRVKSEPGWMTNTMGFVGDTVEGLSDRLDGLNIVDERLLTHPVTEVSNLLRRVAGTITEISFFTFVCWLGECAAPWTSEGARCDHGYVAAADARRECVAVFYKVLAASAVDFLGENVSRWNQMFDLMLRHDIDKT